MFAFASRMFRDKLKSLIIYSIFSIGFLEMYVAIFPIISQRADQFDKILSTLPPEVFKAVGMDVSTLSFGNFESYLSTEYISLLWPILAIIFAISIANYISVNEVDKGTIETLMSLPVNRTRIFIERYFTGLLILFIFCAISIFGVLPLAMIHGVDFSFVNYLTTTIGSCLFIWAIYSLATLMSVIFSEKGKATMISAGILMLMYVVHIISTLNESLKNIQYLSFFHYYKGSDLLAKNVYPEFVLLALGGFAILSTIGAIVWFNRRDLSV